MSSLIIANRTNTYRILAELCWEQKKRNFITMRIKRRLLIRAFRCIPENTYDLPHVHG